jgi:hypothetical protein
MKTCKNHSDRKALAFNLCRACYDATPKQLARRKRYKALKFPKEPLITYKDTPEFKEYIEKYKETEQYKAYIKEITRQRNLRWYHNNSQEANARHKAWLLKKKGGVTLDSQTQTKRNNIPAD